MRKKSDQYKLENKKNQEKHKGRLKQMDARKHSLYETDLDETWKAFKRKRIKTKTSEHTPGIKKLNKKKKKIL